MIDLSQVPPVIADGIDPRLRSMLDYKPDGVRLIFAGPDAEFIRALTTIYRVHVECRDVLVTQMAGHILVTLSGTHNADGLMIDLALCEDGCFNVTPALSFTMNRSAGARKRIRPKRGYADRTILALEGLIFRHVMPFKGGVQ